MQTFTPLECNLFLKPCDLRVSSCFNCKEMCFKNLQTYFKFEILIFSIGRHKINNNIIISTMNRTDQIIVDRINNEKLSFEFVQSTQYSLLMN